MKRVLTGFSISFKIKTMIFIIFIVIFVNLILGLSFYHISSNIIEKQTQDAMLNNLNNVSNYIESNLKQINNALAKIILNYQIMSYGEANPENYSYDFLMMSQYIKKFLTEIKSDNEDIHSIYLYYLYNKHFFCDNLNKTYTYNDIYDSDWYRQITSGRLNKWTLIKDTTRYGESDDYIVILLKEIKNQSMTKLIGYVSANINLKSFEEKFEDIRLGKTGKMYIVDSEKRIIYHPDTELINTHAQIKDDLLKDSNRVSFIDNDNMFVSYIKSELADWVFVAEIPYKEIIHPVETLKKYAYILLVFCIFIALIYSIITSNVIFSPIKKLMKYMQAAGNYDFEVKIDENRKDEFGLLYKSFNKMISKINTLVQDIFVQQLSIKDLRLKIVQSQLSPHFLYNTLDAIHWAAKENEMDEVCQMIYWLSDYFRKSLSEGKDIITVTECAQLINSYIRLQQIRYYDKINFHVYVDPRVSNVEVLKYLFQPIVENSIKHGVEKKSGQGRIYINWEYMEDGKVKFVVRDNGKGITEEKMKEIKEALTDENYNNEGNFALKNINLQLKLFYGSDSHLEIESVYQEGTTVSLVIR